MLLILRLQPEILYYRAALCDPVVKAVSRSAGLLILETWLLHKCNYVS